MKNATRVGNFKDSIDLESLISELKAAKPDRRTTDNPYGEAVELDPELKAAKEFMGQQWRDAGYMDSPSVEWLNYYPEQHFSSSVVKTFSKLVNADPYNIWISSLMPGKTVPWHWDIIKDYQKHRNNPKVVRYSMFIDKPQIGKVFILKDEAFHMIEQGEVYQWTKWDEWHLGFNAGLSQKFIFNYIGFDKT